MNGILTCDGEDNLPPRGKAVGNEIFEMDDLVSESDEFLTTERKLEICDQILSLAPFSRPENEEELRHFLCWIQEQCADDYAKIRAGDLSEYVDFE